MIDGLFAVGLLLTTATLWRFGGLPIGIGELCLVAWLGLMACSCLLDRNVRIGLALSRLLRFWGLLAIALSIGTLTGLAIGEKYDLTWFLHDTFAYPLVGLVSCASMIEPGAYSRLHRAAWTFLILSGVSLTVLLLCGAELLSLPGIDPWFWDRFRGWAQNPSQLAELCLVAALVGLYLADIAARGRDRFIALLCMIPAIWAGRITQTDALSYALALALVAFLAAKLYEWATTPGPRSSLVFLLLFALPVLIAAAIPVMVSAMSNAGDQVVSVLSKRGGKDAQQEADLRFTLWREALARGLHVGMLGLGPGPHLPIPVEIAAARADSSLDSRPTDLAEPEQGAANNFEAHNTVFDLFVQGGLIASLAYIWLMVRAGMNALRNRSAGLIAMICGLNLYALSVLAIRLPLFWLAVALCLLPGREAPAVEYHMPAGERNR